MIISLKKQDNIAKSLLTKWINQGEGVESPEIYDKMDDFHKWQRRQSVREFGEEIINLLIAADLYYPLKFVKFEQEETPELPDSLKNKIHDKDLQTFLNCEHSFEPFEEEVLPVDKCTKCDGIVMHKAFRRKIDNNV